MSTATSHGSSINHGQLSSSSSANSIAALSEVAELSESDGSGGWHGMDREESPVEVYRLATTARRVKVVPLCYTGDGSSTVNGSWSDNDKGNALYSKSLAEYFRWGPSDDQVSNKVFG